MFVCSWEERQPSVCPNQTINLWIQRKISVKYWFPTWTNWMTKALYNIGELQYIRMNTTNLWIKQSWNAKFIGLWCVQTCLNPCVLINLRISFYFCILLIYWQLQKFDKAIIYTTNLWFWYSLYSTVTTYHKPMNNRTIHLLQFSHKPMKTKPHTYENQTTHLWLYHRNTLICKLLYTQYILYYLYYKRIKE